MNPIFPSKSAQLLWKCDVTSRMDLLAVRLRSRQVTHLLGYARREQSLIACSLFELLAAEWNTNRLEVFFYLETNHFRVYSKNSSDLSFESHSLCTTEKLEDPARLLISREAPCSIRRVAWEDVSWILSKLSEDAVFEEIRAQNLEILETFLQNECLSNSEEAEDFSPLNTRAA